MKPVLVGDKIRLHRFIFHGEKSHLNGLVVYVVAPQGEMMGQRRFLVQFGPDGDYHQILVTEDQFETLGASQ